jgi:divalent metal cation (Fe/Co/Zn/Cd) transporter
MATATVTPTVAATVSDLRVCRPIIRGTNSTTHYPTCHTWRAPRLTCQCACWIVAAAYSKRTQRSASLSTVTAHSAAREGLVRRGIALEVFTLSWMTVEAAVAVAAGVAAGSVALLAFGIDSVIEFVAALVVLQTFRAEQAGRPGTSEHRALRIIGITFFLLAAYIVADAAYTLIAASRPESSVAGVAVTAAALLVMPSLSLLKRRTGTALASQMLLADAAESLFCAYLSATVLVGLLLNAILGWWWADPVAALAVVPLVIKEGLEAFEDDDA